MVKMIRELEPGGGGLKFLEEVREGDPHHYSSGGDHLQMDHKELGREWSEEQVEVVSGEIQGLCGGLGDGDVVTGRNGATDSVHSGLDVSVLVMHNAEWSLFLNENQTHSVGHSF